MENAGPRYGVTGCGKHGASVKNTRKPLFRLMNFPNHHEKSKFVMKLKRKSIGVKRVFRS